LVLEIATLRDPDAPAHERHAAKMRALLERWPELGASTALFGAAA